MIGRNRIHWHFVANFFFSLWGSKTRKDVLKTSEEAERGLVSNMSWLKTLYLLLVRLLDIWPRRQSCWLHRDVQLYEWITIQNDKNCTEHQHFFMWHSVVSTWNFLDCASTHAYEGSRVLLRNGNNESAPLIPGFYFCPAVTRSQRTLSALPVSPSISLRTERANELLLEGQRWSQSKHMRWLLFKDSNSFFWNKKRGNTGGEEAKLQAESRMEE